MWLRAPPPATLPRAARSRATAGCHLRPCLVQSPENWPIGAAYEGSSCLAWAELWSRAEDEPVSFPAGGRDPGRAGVHRRSADLHRPVGGRANSTMWVRTWARRDKDPTCTRCGHRVAATIGMPRHGFRPPRRRFVACGVANRPLRPPRPRRSCRFVAPHAASRRTTREWHAVPPGAVSPEHVAEEGEPAEQGEPSARGGRHALPFRRFRARSSTVERGTLNP